MQFALIPPGSFLQGSPPAEPERRSDEGPQRIVRITPPFYLGVTAVSQRIYWGVMSENPEASFLGDEDDLPIEYVSWPEAAAFCERLSTLKTELAAGRVYRLPTEAEWEYACRAGITSAYAFGAVIDSTLCNFDGRHPLPGAKLGPYREETCPVLSFLPNAFGLYQMHGNVWEWCNDIYFPTAYLRAELIDPQGPQYVRQREERVVRGGAWVSDGRECRSAMRGRMEPTLRDNDVGFRVVMECPAGRATSSRAKR